MIHRKKLIEVALLLPEINDASPDEKMPSIGPHPNGIHHDLSGRSVWMLGAS